MKFLFIFFLLPAGLFAQDITGVWTGTLYNDTTKQYIKYELAISEFEGKLSGYSHTIFIIDSVENIGVKSIKIKKSGEQYQVEDDKLIYNNYTAPPAKGVRTYSLLTFSKKNDSTLVLHGPWSTNQTRIFKRLTGNIYLQKKMKIINDPIISKLLELGLTHSLSFMTQQDKPEELVVVNKPATSFDKPKIKADDKSDTNTLEEKVPEKSVSDNSTNFKNTEKLKSEISNEQSYPKLEKSSIKENRLTIPSNSIQDTIRSSSLAAVLPNTSKILSSAKQEKAENEMPDAISNKKTNSVNATTLIPVKDSLKNKISGGEAIINEKTQSVKKDAQEKILPNNENLVKTSPNKKSSIPELTGKDILAPTLKKDSLGNENTIAKSGHLAAAGIAARKIETIKSVEIKNDSLTLTLYDNGEVDGDTVSVLLNGKVIMPMEGLSTKAINKTIYLTPAMGDSIVLIMYAENLGSIPPNTGLLVVHDGENTYYIRFSGDLQQNAAIILKRKRKN